MRFVNPEEFSFVEHWNLNDKKLAAAFFFKLKRKYFYIDSDEFYAYIKYRIFMEYKKNPKIDASFDLFGKIRMELFRMNNKNKTDKDNLMLAENSLIDDLFPYTDSEATYQSMLEDISKVCCEKTAIAVDKKIKQQQLTRNEYYLLKKNKDIIIEYINL